MGLLIINAMNCKASIFQDIPQKIFETFIVGIQFRWHAISDPEKIFLKIFKSSDSFLNGKYKYDVHSDSFWRKKSFSDTLAKLPHKLKALTKIGPNIVMFVWVAIRIYFCNFFLSKNSSAVSSEFHSIWDVKQNKMPQGIVY